MSVRHGLLALLLCGSKHGYQLRSEFESSTHGTWPLNIGQVYSTLTRLERDGLVLAADTGAEAGSRERVSYEITSAGRDEVRRWFGTAVAAADRPRDELAIKLALAVLAPGVDVRAIVQTQRTASMRALQDYTRLKQDREGSDEPAWTLVLDAMIFQVEAEIRWLDHCEAYVARNPEATLPPGTVESGVRTGHSSDDEAGDEEEMPS